MTKDKEYTDMIFRKFSDGDIIALMINNKENNGLCASYMTVGQHGSVSLDLVNDLESVDISTAWSLIMELESIGYRVNMVTTQDKVAA